MSESSTLVTPLRDAVDHDHRTCRRVLRVAISEEMLDHRHLSEGDRVHVIESSDGILVVPFAPDFEGAMQLYEEGVDTYHELLQQFSN